MHWIPIIVGGLVGLWLGLRGGVFLGIGAGAALGYLLAQHRSLQDKIKALSAQIEGSPDTRRLAATPARKSEPEPPSVQPLAETPAPPAPAHVVKKTVE